MERKISYFPNGITTTRTYKAIALHDVVKAIQCQKSKTLTQNLRAIADQEKASKYKRTEFDYVTFSGTFKTRKSDKLIAYSSYIVIDLDDVDPIEVKAKLLNQTHFDVALMFTSPGGYGVKVVVPSTTAEQHKQVFRMYQRCFDEELGLEVDNSGSDVARACFIAYDEEVYFNPEATWRKVEKYWDAPSHDPLQHAASNGGGQFVGLSPFDDYNSRGNALALLEAYGWRQCETKTDEIRLTRPGKKGGVSASFRVSDKLFYVFTSNSAFEGSKGYNPSQVFTTLVCGGDTKVAYKKLLEMGFGEKLTPAYPSNGALGKVSENGKIDFYTFPDGKPVIEASRLNRFLKQEGFMRISEQGNDTITIIKNRNKILKPFNYKTDTIAFLKHHINHPEHRSEIENQLIQQRVRIENSWKLMKGEPYNLQKDTKDAVYLPFKNGVCKVTKEGIEMIDYKSKEIAFFIDNIESQKHHFETRDLSKRGIGDFEKFLIYAIVGRETDDITERERDDIRAFYSMIGYLISNYKDPSASPAVILTDEGADGKKRRGGRGKSLLTEAIKQVRCTIFRDGSKFNPNYVHVYGDLERYHDVYILDELSTGFGLDKLFADITGDITAERKGTAAVTIPFKDAPKFVITTNQIVRYDEDADSFNRRFVEYQFSNFWNKEHVPINHFKRRFFDEWDDKEWQLYFEFLIICAMQYLTTGLKKITYSKDEDNYWIYFSNDVVLDEFERILEVMRERGEFRVSDFLNEYKKNSPLRNEKFFHHNNTGKMIDVYFKKHEVDIKFQAKDKLWSFPDSESGCVDNTDDILVDNSGNSGFFSD